MPESTVSLERPLSILARTLDSAFDVGTNRRGDVSGAGWLYALPRLEYGTVLCRGVPSAATLTALVRIGDRVVIVDASTRRRRRAETLARTRGWNRVIVVARETDTREAADADLVIASRGAAGLIVRVGPEADPDEATLGDGNHGVLTLALTPARGEVRSAVPAGDRAMRATINVLGLEGTLASHPRLAAWEERLRRAVNVPLRLPTRTVGITGPPDLGQSKVPAYIGTVAAAAGHDLDDWGWGVAARGDYDSQKVLVLLRPPGSEAPTGIVKVTRSAAHAPRLENEGAALARLAGLPIAAGRAPERWFAGRHAGRALLGESLVDGVPFAQRATWQEDCPVLDDALGWLAAYGAATRVEVPAQLVADALLGLLDRFVAIYRPTSDEAAALRDRFTRLGRISEPLLVVHQHGDPGIWNLLVDPSGRTVFLDWEAAEPDGLPLWDLFYLFRSYAVSASRRRDRVRDRLEGTSRHMLAASPLGDRLVRAVEDYRAAVGLPVEAVEGLLYGCWLHRSLKEATRMPADRLHEGQFVRLIRKMLMEPAAPTMVRLFGGQP